MADVERAGPNPPKPASMRDLAAVAALSTAAAGVVFAAPGVPGRRWLGLAFLLLAPGYALMAALYPEPPGRPGTRAPSRDERLVLAFGLSLGLLAPVGALLNATPWGVTSASTTLAALVLVAAGCAGAWIRRRRLAPRERTPARKGASAPGPRRSPWIAMVLVLLLGATTGALAQVLQHDDAPRPYTAFYLYHHGSEWDRGDQAQPMAFNGSTTFAVGVENREGHPAAYTVHAVAERGDWTNRTGTHAFRADGTTTFGRWNVSLDAGGDETWDVTFTPEAPGLHRLRLTLDRAGADTSPYRELTLWVFAHP